MARWRGKKRIQRTAALGVLAATVFVVLGIIATRINWDSVSLVVLIIILLAFAGYAINQLLRVVQFQLAQQKKIQRASKFKNTAQMNFLSPTDFEHYVGTVYEQLGYTVTVTKQSGDGGIDLILTNRDGTYGVQVKRYSEKNIVGRPDLQKLVGACLGKYEKMIFITTSDYSAEAGVYAAQQGIILIDGKSLTAMAEKAFGDNHEQKAFSFGFLRKMEKIN